MEEQIDLVLVLAEVRDFLDLAVLESEDQAPGQIQSAAGVAPPAVMVENSWIFSTFAMLPGRWTIWWPGRIQ